MPASLVRSPFRRHLSCVLLATLASLETASAQEQKFASHPPARPLPTPVQRPLPEGVVRYADARNGDDAHDGSAARPWKTVSRAATLLKPGDTLCLRGGVYYEHATMRLLGTRERPITIRSAPGELAILDGGLREFFETPKEAWEPCPGGAEGEFRSIRAYPTLGGRLGDTNLLGNFGDSMTPLHGYRFLSDLRSDNPFWNVPGKTEDDGEVYCGPGLFYDPASGRIHVRLAPTRLPGLGDDNYRGESDPRKLPLVVAGHEGGSVVTLDESRHVRLQDLVLRGAREATLSIRECADVELEGLVVYGGSAPVSVRDSVGLRVHHTACRGLAAPWTFRGSLKYRAIESRLFSASGWAPTGVDSRDMELAYCEFTDSVDGVFLGNVRGVRFHHNLLDNVSDDGLFVTAATGYDGRTSGGDVQVYQNYLSRCLTTFAFGVGHGRQKTIESGGKQTGDGVWVYRNVFDFRRPVHYHWPTGPDAPQEITYRGRYGGDHGSPAWEPQWIYHNTLLVDAPSRGEYGSFGVAHGMGHGVRRRVFNNIFCQLQGSPGAALPPPDVDFQTDGNLFWSVADAANGADSANVLKKFRQSPTFAASQKNYPPGWTAHDLWADPKFVAIDVDWRRPVDLRLQPTSPAIDAGVAVPADWPDPLRATDAGAADQGALPLGHAGWTIGVRGRLAIQGSPLDGPSHAPTGSNDASQWPRVARWTFPDAHDDALRRSGDRPALVYCGYPAFDAPLVSFALRKQNVPVELVEKRWLDVAEFSKYRLVAIDGSFPRAKIEPNRFGEADLVALESYLASGGTLLLMRGQNDLFATPKGQETLFRWIGQSPPESAPRVQIRQPNHPWVRHLNGETLPWMQAKNAGVLRASRGENLIGTRAGATMLGRFPVGNGQLIYFGWSVAQALPEGRRPATFAQEQAYEQQMETLTRLIADVVK